jgi:Lysyl oxidase
LDTIHNPDQCAIDEGCLRGLGVRYVLKFDTHIKNIGNRDYYIGTPPDDPNQPTTQFVWDPCHRHWHYRGYAEYVIRDQAGAVPLGTKNGFCVLDLECDDGGRPKFTCDKMGITADCGDVYDNELPCQWVDITGLRPGLYSLAVRVNWTQQPDTTGRVELDYSNNVAQVCFQLTYAGERPSVRILDIDCDTYRDCEGVLLGSAVPDCNGVCNGPDAFGDLDNDSAQENSDILAYMNKIMQNDSTATSCNDLYQDGALNILDAAALTECVKHRDDPNYWGLRFPCLFPIMKEEDLNGTAILYAGKLDTIAKTFEVRIFNAGQKISAFDFTVEGLQIDTVINLTQFRGDLRFTEDGRIVGLATQTQMQKNQIPSNFLRIQYQKITAPKVCIGSIRAFANSQYRHMNARASTTNCTTAPTFVSTGEVGEAGVAVFAQPNPFRDNTTLYFDNPSGQALHLVMTDVVGRPVQTWQEVRGASLDIPRGNLPSGVYWLTISDGVGRTTVKLLAE